MKSHQPLYRLNKIVKIFLSILFLSLLATRPALSQNSNPGLDNFVVAKVNNQVITNIDITNGYNFFLSNLKISITSNQERSRLIEQVINKMIDEELIRQESVKLDIGVTKQEIDDILKSINKAGASDSYRQQIATNLAWNKIVDQQIKPRIKIYDSEILEFFEEKKINKNIDQFLLAQIVIGNNNGSLKIAQEICNKLKNGANFNEMVAQFSDLSAKENNGLIGLVGQKDIDSRIYNAISKLEKNQYSDPVALDDGYHIFKILDKKLSTKLNPDDVNLANNAIFNQKVQILAKEYLSNLRRNSFIELNPLPANFLAPGKEKYEEYFVN
jgi:peptidyl-prolyl cis-trans isomerase SurA